MIKLQGLSGEELWEVARQTADAFYDYTYNGEDIGLIKYISSREAMFIYISVIVQAAYKAGVQRENLQRYTEPSEEVRRSEAI